VPPILRGGKKVAWEGEGKVREPGSGGRVGDGRRGGEGLLV